MSSYLPHNFPVLESSLHKDSLWDIEHTNTGQIQILGVTTF